MADIEIRLRSRVDGRFTRSLIADLEKIGTTEAVYPEEVRSGGWEQDADE